MSALSRSVERAPRERPGASGMSFSIVIQCPIHPTYMAKISPSSACKACRLMFAVRNNTNRVLSVPRDERTDVDEIIIQGVE
jgi:hypothetical protein